MLEYLNYLSGLIGSITIVLFMFGVAIAGPFFLFIQLHNEEPTSSQKLRWIVAAVTFFVCLFLFIVTGGYIGRQFGYSALGMGGGLLSFYYAYNWFTSLLPSTCPISSE